MFKSLKCILSLCILVAYKYIVFDSLLIVNQIIDMLVAFNVCIWQLFSEVEKTYEKKKTQHCELWCHSNKLFVIIILLIVNQNMSRLHNKLLR